MRHPASRDSLEVFLRNLDARLERQERHSHNVSGRGAPSADENNTARLGSDGLIYARKIAYKPTVPTADDFAAPTIPLGSIWVGHPVPVTAPPLPPEPTLFCDEFDRADSASLGSDWVTPTIAYGTVHPLHIRANAAVADEDLSAFPGNEWGYAQCVHLGQAVEITVSRPDWTTTGTFQNFFELDIKGNTTDASCYQLRIEAKPTAAAGGWWGIQPLDATGHGLGADYLAEGSLGYPMPSTFRFEALSTGELVATINGSVVAWFVPPSSVDGVPAPTGDRVMIGCSWTGFDDPAPTSSQPLIERACVGPAVAPTCTTWSDDFERADGPLGSNWVLGVETGTGETPVLPTISSGAAVWPRYGTTHYVAAAQWATPVDAAAQFIELTFDNWVFPQDRYNYVIVEVWNFGDPLGGDPTTHDPPRRAGQWQLGLGIGQQITASIYSYLDDGDTSDGVYVQWYGDTTPYPWPRSGPQTIRLESYANGRQVFFINGTSVLDYVETTTPWTGTGRNQGFWASWDYLNPPVTAPQILSVSGGCLAPSPTVASRASVTPMALPTGCAVGDDFERANGPLGSDWLQGTYVANYIDNPQPMVIESGAAVASADTTPGTPDPASYTECLAKWHEPIDGDQMIEVTVDTFFTTDASAYSGGWVQLYLQAHDEATNAGAATCIFTHSAGDTSVGVLIETVYPNANHSGNDAFADFPRDLSEPVTFRFECDVDGTRRAYVDGTLALTVAPHSTFAPGPWVMIAADWPQGDPKCRILSTCLREAVPEPPTPTPTPALPTGPGLLRAWNGNNWTEPAPAWAYMPQGWVPATAVHVWDGYQWVDPP